MNKTLLMMSCLLLICVHPIYSEPASLPVQGLHCSAPGKDDLEMCLKFIEEVLPKEGVNLLILEFGYRFQFESHPELALPNSLDKNDVKKILAACQKANIKLIPQFNCLGHQSWSKTTFPLLTKYPEFDETPGKYPNNEDIYCRSYCPLHPKVHDIIFALIDELADACEAEDFHVGMDEVFLLGDEDCPRCKDKSKAELFAYEVKLLRDHLAKSNRILWMWGDRFLDGELTGLGKWEASMDDTAPAIDLVPKDIVICDWHYESAPPTAVYFAIKGFNVVSSPWRKEDVALGQLQIMNTIREISNPEIAQRMKGMLHTTWCGMGPFMRAYYGEKVRSESARETAHCFKVLYEAIRNGQ
ncbi:MAG: family 20 glycosylhydrolase [bacterium]